jgi:hypothetical protein
VTFDPERHAAISAAGDALVVYLADDGTGTIRLHVVRYNHSLNPIIRYFSGPTLFDANSGDVVDAKVVLDAQGDGLLVWVQQSSGIPRLYASVYVGISESFTPPQLIDGTGENTVPEGVGGFDVALDAVGNGVIGFYENPIAPGLCEAFGVHFNKFANQGAPAFTAPEKVHLPGYTTPGHTVQKMLAVAGPANSGYLLTLQDSDPGGATAIHCSVSRFSSESSLSAFNAVTRVNPPGYDDDVTDFSGIVLPDGDGLFIYEQANPTSNRTRIWSRIFDSATDGFTELMPRDLAPQTSASAMDFGGPMLQARADGVAVAMFLSTGPGAALHTNVFHPETRSFDTTQSTVVSGSGGDVGSRFLFAFQSGGSGEAVFTQAVSGTGGPYRMYASRFTGGSRAFSDPPRACDLGTAEKGPINTMTFSNPTPVGIGFDGSGRCLVGFTLSDGMLDRLYVNRGPLANPHQFEGARPVDGAIRGSLFSGSATRTEVVPGDAILALDTAGTGGIAVWRQREIMGANTIVRLFGASYHGYNQAPSPMLRGVQHIDEHAADPNRPVILYDGAGTTTGAVTAFVQDVAGSEELFIRVYDGTGNQFDLPGLTSQDNGTPGAIQDVKVVAGQGDDAFIFFLQDDGTGTIHLYGRWYRASDRTLVNLRVGMAANVPLSNTGGTYGSVTDLAATSRAGRAFAAFRQVDGTGFEVFGLRVDADGTVTGAARFSSGSGTALGAPSLVAGSAGRGLVLFQEGQALMARVVALASFGQTPPGTPDSVSGSGPVGAVEASGDGFGNFLVAFESGTSGGNGISILFRRFFNVSNAWESGPLAVSPAGTANIDYRMPKIQATVGGRGLILFKVNDRSSVPADMSLMAVTYDAAQATSLAAPVIVDNDAATLNGLDVDTAAIAMEPLSGRGFITFTQDTDGTVNVQNRLFSRGFDLSRIGTANPVFYVTAVDMTEGGASAQTEVSLFLSAVAGDGKGFLVHTERIPTGMPSTTVTHLFARPFDADTFTFGPTKVASRLMNPGAGNVWGEGVDSTKVLLGPNNEAFILHTVLQADAGIPTTYRRLYANIHK